MPDPPPGDGHRGVRDVPVEADIVDAAHGDRTEVERVRVVLRAHLGLTDRLLAYATLGVQLALLGQPPGDLAHLDAFLGAPADPHAQLLEVDELCPEPHRGAMHNLEPITPLRPIPVHRRTHLLDDEPADGAVALEPLQLLAHPRHLVA
ncbi:MAG: hypothetical protein H5T77_18510 [Nocardioides sp.]|nr:hypothetical protein [Nocardioides sp.]MBC7278465.1 hypothetical protein [Nocardioides sp.]